MAPNADKEKHWSADAHLNKRMRVHRSHGSRANGQTAAAVRGGRVQASQAQRSRQQHRYDTPLTPCPPPLPQVPETHPPSALADGGAGGGINDAGALDGRDFGSKDGALSGAPLADALLAARTAHSPGDNYRGNTRNARVLTSADLDECYGDPDDDGVPGTPELHSTPRQRTCASKRKRGDAVGKANNADLSEQFHKSPRKANLHASKDGNSVDLPMHHEGQPAIAPDDCSTNTKVPENQPAASLMKADEEGDTGEMCVAETLVDLWSSQESSQEQHAVPPIIAPAAPDAMEPEATATCAEPAHCSVSAREADAQGENLRHAPKLSSAAAAAVAAAEEEEKQKERNHKEDAQVHPAVHLNPVMKAKRKARKRRKSGQWAGTGAPMSDHLHPLRHVLHQRSLQKLGNFLCRQRAKQWALREFVDPALHVLQTSSEDGTALQPSFLSHPHHVQRLPRVCWALCRTMQYSHRRNNCASSHEPVKLNGSASNLYLQQLHPSNKCSFSHDNASANSSVHSHGSRRNRGFTRRLMREQHDAENAEISRWQQWRHRRRESSNCKQSTRTSNVNSARVNNGDRSTCSDSKGFTGEPLSVLIGRRCIAVHPASQAPRRGVVLCLAEESGHVLVQFDEHAAGVEKVPHNHVALAPATEGTHAKSSHNVALLCESDVAALAHTSRIPKELLRSATLLERKDALLQELARLNDAASKASEVGQKLRQEYAQVMLQLQKIDVQLDTALRSMQSRGKPCSTGLSQNLNSFLAEEQHSIRRHCPHSNAMEDAAVGALSAIASPHLGYTRAKPIARVLQALLPSEVDKNERFYEVEHWLQEIESKLRMHGSHSAT